MSIIYYIFASAATLIPGAVESYDAHWVLDEKFSYEFQCENTSVFVSGENSYSIVDGGATYVTSIKHGDGVVAKRILDVVNNKLRAAARQTRPYGYCDDNGVMRIVFEYRPLEDEAGNAIERIALYIGGGNDGEVVDF